MHAIAARRCCEFDASQGLHGVLGGSQRGSQEDGSVGLSTPEDLHLIPRTHSCFVVVVAIVCLFVHVLKPGMVTVCVSNPDARDRDWLTGALWPPKRHIAQKSESTEVNF